MSDKKAQKESNLCRLNEFLSVDRTIFDELGIYNAFIGTDSRLFIDPFLFDGLPDDVFAEARIKIKAHFSKVIKLLSVSKTRGDRAWNKAVEMLIFEENAGLALGYGMGTTFGSAIGPELAARLAESAAELLDYGIDDPEIFELIGLFTKDFGPDRLSDMSAKILYDEIVEYTAEKFKLLKIQKKNIPATVSINGCELPATHKGAPILFLPKVVLRPLPVAQSFEEIASAAGFNADLRRRYNALLAPLLATPKSKRTKGKIKEYLYEDPERLHIITDAYRQADPVKTRYNFDKDPAGEDFYYEAGRDLAEAISLGQYTQDALGLKKMVRDIVKDFKRAVEVHGSWELLHDDRKKPRKERSAQLMFYAMSLKTCEQMNVDVIRESSGGRGSLDFKFTEGFTGGVALEVKLSSNSHLVSGFKKQLPIYADVERCSHAVYLIIRVTEQSKQIEEILDLVKKKEELKEQTPEVVIVDARPKPTASKVR